MGVSAVKNRPLHRSFAYVFPFDLISMVEPGEDIEPFLEDHDHPEAPLNLQ